jgi:hypothetical protein
MALDFNAKETHSGSEDDLEAESTELTSDDILAPTCMFWGMIIGLALFGGSVLIWILENVSKIGQ